MCTLGCALVDGLSSDEDVALYVDYGQGGVCYMWAEIGRVYQPSLEVGSMVWIPAVCCRACSLLQMHEWTIQNEPPTVARVQYVFATI